MRGTPMSTEIRVALVFEQAEGVEALKAALANAGVQIAAECRASAMDAKAILGSGADAIVVNLDADLADLLDEVTDALDASERPVIYNDPTASSDLSGWDRARWMRHLSAKLKGNNDVTPPPPPGAEAIPVPMARKTAVPPAAAVYTAAIAVEVPEVSLDLAAEAESFPITPVEVDLMEVSFAPPAEPEPEPGPADPTDNFDGILDLSFEPALDLPGDEGGDLGELSLAELDMELTLDDAQAPAADSLLSDTIELPIEPERTSASSDALTIGDDIADLDALFDMPPLDASDNTSSGSDQLSSLDELDSLFSSAPDDQRAPPSIIETSELNDLDAMFKDFEASQSASNTTSDEEAKAAPDQSRGVRDFTALTENLSWSLEEVEEPEPAASKRAVDEATFEWRLEGGPAPKVVEPAPAPARKPEPPAPSVPADLEASLALADFSLMDLDEDQGVSTTPPQETLANDFDTLDFSAIDLDLGDDGAATPSSKTSASETELGFAELDFDLSLDVDDATVSADLAGSESRELDELDTLFAPAQSAPVHGLNLPDLNRLFVLGASIGGPEAIKAFLSRIPANIAASFMVAQHMGAEFLEMMAAQLDVATKLSVRYPKAGERLRHGEVVVAPASEQVCIDDTGHLQFSSMSAATPYNPSIDQLVRDATDRFGDQVTLILFSGMGTDAIEGGRYLSERGGQVWAQDRASCVIATMIDAAKSQGIVKFEGSPQALAERVLESLA